MLQIGSIISSITSGTLLNHNLAQYQQYQLIHHLVQKHNNVMKYNYEMVNYPYSYHP